MPEVQQNNMMAWTPESCLYNISCQYDTYCHDFDTLEIPKTWASPHSDKLDGNDQLQRKSTQPLSSLSSVHH